MSHNTGLDDSLLTKYPIFSINDLNVSIQTHEGCDGVFY